MAALSESEEASVYYALSLRWQADIDALVDDFTDWYSVFVAVAVPYAAMDGAKYPFAFSALTAAIIERLGEPRITDPHQASLYDLSCQQHHRNAAGKYIERLGGYDALARAQRQSGRKTEGIVVH